MTVTGFAGVNEWEYPVEAYPKGYDLKNGAATALSIIDIDGSKAL